MTVEIAVDAIAKSGIEVVIAEKPKVKANGWVKYERDGEIKHIPPHRVQGMTESNPEVKSERNGQKYYDSDVIYQSPHGRV